MNLSITYSYKHPGTKKKTGELVIRCSSFWAMSSMKFEYSFWPPFCRFPAKESRDLCSRQRHFQASHLINQPLFVEKEQSDR